MRVVGSLATAAPSNVIRLAACSRVKDFISFVSFGKSSARQRPQLRTKPATIKILMIIFFPFRLTKVSPHRFLDKCD